MLKSAFEQASRGERLCKRLSQKWRCYYPSVSAKANKGYPVFQCTHPPNVTSTYFSMGDPYSTYDRRGEGWWSKLVCKRTWGGGVGQFCTYFLWSPKRLPPQKNKLEGLVIQLLCFTTKRKVASMWAVEATKAVFWADVTKAFGYYISQIRQLVGQ